MKSCQLLKPKCIRKTRNTLCGMRLSVTLLKFCEKLLRQRKISLKSDNWLLSYGQKRLSIRKPSAISTILKIVIFPHITIIKLQMFCCTPNFIKNRIIFFGWEMAVCNYYQHSGNLPACICCYIVILYHIFTDITHKRWHLYLDISHSFYMREC